MSNTSAAIKGPVPNYPGIAASLLIVAWAALFPTACQTAQHPYHGFVLVPAEDAMAGLSDEQNRLVSSRGAPDIVWKKPEPFVMFLWVYCKKDATVDQYAFDTQGALLEAFTAAGNSDLCTIPLRQ